MPGRELNPTPSADLRGLVEAARLAHAWDPHYVDTRPSAVFREFGRWRWLVVPLVGLAIAGFVWVVSALAGFANTPVN